MKFEIFPRRIKYTLLYALGFALTQLLLKWDGINYEYHIYEGLKIGLPFGYTMATMDDYWKFKKDKKDAAKKTEGDEKDSDIS